MLMSGNKVPMDAYPPPSYPGVAQPGAGDGYGGQPNYPGVALAQPQQTVMIVPQNNPNREGEAGAAVTMTGAYLSSCLTLWLCGNVLFGFIGFILAIVGSAYIGSNNKLSRHLSTASMVVTWVGFVVTIIVIVTVVVVMVEQVEDNTGFNFGDVESSVNDGYNDANKAVHDEYNDADKAVKGGFNAFKGLFTTTRKPFWQG